jgi:hypothetical protein
MLTEQVSVADRAPEVSVAWLPRPNDGRLKSLSMKLFLQVEKDLEHLRLVRIDSEHILPHLDRKGSARKDGFFEARPAILRVVGFEQEDLAARLHQGPRPRQDLASISAGIAQAVESATVDRGVR